MHTHFLHSEQGGGNICAQFHNMLSARTAVQPGSTFKPVTAVAALKAGLDPNRRIYDGRYIEMGGHKFGCSNYNNGLGSHGYQTLAQGIQNSCNYYFYCIGTGIDWNTKNKTSLGYKITIDDNGP